MPLSHLEKHISPCENLVARVNSNGDSTSAGGGSFFAYDFKDSPTPPHPPVKIKRAGDVNSSKEEPPNWVSRRKKTSNHGYHTVS